ncbi:MAG: formate dehydrogenase subunit gamma [Rubritepida sp.]|nr:formate dehydrogenase subunit gamma [Rubritepida sp.]
MRLLTLALTAMLLSAPVMAQQQPDAAPAMPTVEQPLVIERAPLSAGEPALQGGTSMPTQPGGQEWRIFHDETLAWVGGVSVGGILLLLIVFYLARGRIMIDGGPTGRTLQRFNLLERANHWMVAASFILLALSGLNVTFGRHLLLPMIGPDAFFSVARYGALVHEYIAVPFTLGLVVMLLLWVRHSIPNRGDIAWLRMGGGLIGKGYPAAARFNAGQKLVFWITVLGGGFVAVSGYFLIFPFSATIGFVDMQMAQMVHGILAVLMVAAMLAHIYLRTIGMEGAIDAMSTGQVDLAWAKQHHSIWVEEELAEAHRIVTPTGTRPAGD